MKPASFRYSRPASLEEALELLAQHGDLAKPLAGGQSLVPAMNFRLAAPAILVDLNRIDELSYIREGAGGAVRIGAMTRQRAVERSELVATRAPLVTETMPHIAHPQIRNRGTFGGSLAHADPAAELPAVALVLGARFRAARRGMAGGRWIGAGEFFRGLFSTALAPGELLVEVELPAMPAGSGWAFEEAARRHGDFALLGVAAVVTMDKGRIAGARLAYLSAGEGPVEGKCAAAILAGVVPTEEAIRAAAGAAAEKDIDPPADIHASAAFRRHLARVLTARALRRAIERAKNP